MLILFALWFGISVPLVTLGSYFGFKAEEVKHPVRINNIPRSIPPQPWYLHPIPSILVGGILPFGAVFIELFFIMSSIWLAQLYFFFGFLYLVLFILSLTCAEISIVMCYFQLCSEDYKCVTCRGGCRLAEVRAGRPGHPRAFSPLFLPLDRVSAQLVVAVVPDGGVVGAVPLPVLDRLLCDQAGDHEPHFHPAVLWVHGHGELGLLPPHGLHRLHQHPGVCPAHLLGHQGRLGAARADRSEERRLRPGRVGETGRDCGAGKPACGARNNPRHTPTHSLTPPFPPSFFTLHSLT